MGLIALLVRVSDRHLPLYATIINVSQLISCVLQARILKELKDDLIAVINQMALCYDIVNRPPTGYTE